MEVKLLPLVREGQGEFSFSMTWVTINNRILELERKKVLTPEEVEEWNTLVSSEVAGVLKRKIKDEKDNGQAKEENSGA